MSSQSGSESLTEESVVAAVALLAAAVYRIVKLAKEMKNHES